jgi:lysozyme family protein
MVTSGYATTTAFTISQEGGYTDDARDSGNWSSGIVNKGLLIGSNMGVGAPAAIAYMAKTEPGFVVTATWMASLPVAIYNGLALANYWMPLSGDSLPAGINLSVFDDAWNTGVLTAAKKFQTLLGVKADGIIGPETLSAINTVNLEWIASGLSHGMAIALQARLGVTADGIVGPLTLEALKGQPTQRIPTLLFALSDAQTKYYDGLSNFATYGAGWIERTAKRLMTALSLHDSSQPTAAQLRDQAWLLGKGPALNDPRVPRLTELAVGADAVVVPSKFSVWQSIASWILGQNDKIGDCTCVGVANSILQRTTLVGKPSRMTDDQIISLYERFGYTPSDPSTDNGAMEQNVLASWISDGVPTPDGTDKLNCFASLDITNMAELRKACFIGNGIYIGVSLPVTCQGATKWVVTDPSLSGDAAPGSWGGHAVFVAGYDGSGWYLITWGQVMYATDEFFLAYLDEAYALVDPDGFNQKGVNFDGQTLATVSTELQGLAQCSPA